MKGMATYVSRFDGTAATTEDFVDAILAGAREGGASLGFNAERFRRWYHQAGTPELQVERHWDADRGELRLQFRQSTPATPGQPQKLPVVLPLALALVGPDGPLGEEQLFVMEDEESSLTLQATPQLQPPALSIRVAFSTQHLKMTMPLAEIADSRGG